MIKIKTSFFSSLFCFTLLLAGCGAHDPRRLPEAPHVFPMETLAVFGFLPGPFSPEEGGTVRSPLTGSVFSRGPVPEGVSGQLTARLQERLSGELSAELLSPEVARKAFWTVRERAYTGDDLEILRKTGESLETDAILAGYIFRWQERVGSDYSVSRPASAAFELVLIRSADGGILWKGRFDKTQTSLTEDLLDLRTFLKSKGRWMSVADLGDIGLSDLSEQIPVAKKE